MEKRDMYGLNDFNIRKIKFIWNFEIFELLFFIVLSIF